MTKADLDIKGKLLCALIELNVYIELNAAGDNCVPGSDLQKGCAIIVESHQFLQAKRFVNEALNELTQPKREENNDPVHQ